MTHVAIVIEALGRGGAERLLVDTARLISRSRFTLRVYTLFEARRDYAEVLAQLGIPETCLVIAGSQRIGAGVLRLRACLRREPADLVHTHLFAANIVGRIAARLQGIPVVSSYHDADYEPVVRLGNPSLGPGKQAFLRMLDLVTARIANAHAIAVSDYVASSVRRRLRFTAARTTTIPNAVDTATFCPDPHRRAETRRSLGIPDDEPIVLCVGRMTLQKGQQTLIRAMALARVSDAHLLLVGDGPQKGALVELAREVGLADRARFLGTRPDVPDLLRAADILVLPSLHEGFGLVVAEAMASGTPVIASQVGPLPEILSHGETGLLVPPDDPTMLARAVAQLAADSKRRHEIADRARAVALARFSLPLMVSRLRSALRSARSPCCRQSCYPAAAMIVASMSSR